MFACAAALTRSQHAVLSRIWHIRYDSVTQNQEWLNHPASKGQQGTAIALERNAVVTTFLSIKPLRTLTAIERVIFAPHLIVFVFHHPTPLGPLQQSRERFNRCNPVLCRLCFSPPDWYRATWNNTRRGEELSCWPQMKIVTR